MCVFPYEKRYRRVCVWGKDGCKRRRMGVDVWVWAAVEVGKWQKVSSGSLFLRPQAQKADTAPRTQQVQTPACVNRRRPSKA